jgi:hypothetical protein
MIDVAWTGRQLPDCHPIKVLEKTFFYLAATRTASFTESLPWPM